MRVAKALGPKVWVCDVLQGAPQQRSLGGQFAVNIGGKDVLRGFRGPMGEGIVRAERRAKAGSGWKNDVFDPQR